MTSIDHTHNPALRSWVDSANEPASDFPIQNLPFGRFRVEHDPGWRIGVAIGDQVLDLRAADLIDFSDMNRLISLLPEARRELRAQLSAGLAAGSPQQERWSRHLHAQSAVELGLPCEIRDYTDFYVGIHHATAVGKLFRPDNPLLPNYKWVPIGYHGRASTIQPSGHSFHRPLGQIKAADADAPMLAPTKRLDLELELGFVIGRPNAMGHPIPLAEAEDHVFGVTLFNDWSARDFQAWEYQPLGPFLSKNFASTLSPWMVTLEALAPFRQALQRPAGDPQPLPYLQADASQSAGAFDIDLDVLLQTARMRAEGLAPERISRSNAAHAAYWSLAQLVTHHTVNGCALSAGDLFGSGTLSGPKPEQAGSLLELTAGGKHTITLGNGETRTFLEDGDSITLRGRCERAGFQRIGFGDCTATVLPPLGTI
ncbi:MAG: fumarylacetoacetase [Hydrogenophaga sp.]|jgi:fumarylacetoacetase|uniref:fumarylacetoacetase n=1 Tax=Hydrogenophaga sp. TaxID=1904254 RepID=UPI00271F1DFE|nr:fumarylacetoacetase [Hydrogenophaga sp.]MDO9251009.1 fumarylacetoacetase [Hydrogenophaga sp.]MDP2404884.1 fumarylacetoacetase [Hydrogenophaga sp.]MDP3326011.1 fumarylacetoacetase [Hydrogenophaga sp.]MDZ4176206.1 fumarylacetoacetase [Hydrogenophaga sp.]